MSRKTSITNVHVADENHQVLTVTSPPSESFVARREPCAECPWRTDAPQGAFPAEAYRFSARTAYDMAESTFACHMSGAKAPATCAGFLLRGADHNLHVRMAIMQDRYDPEIVSDRGIDLYEGYRSMAIANGVDPDDPAIAPCRGEDELDYNLRYGKGE